MLTVGLPLAVEKTKPFMFYAAAGAPISGSVSAETGVVWGKTPVEKTNPFSGDGDSGVAVVGAAAFFLAASFSFSFGFLLKTGLLEGLEFGHVGVAHVAEAAFLECEVVEFFAIGAEDFELDESLAGFGIAFVGIEVCEFLLAEDVDGGFEWGDAEDAPFGIENGLNKLLFLIGGGGVLVEEAVAVLFVEGSVFGGEEDGAAGESGFDGVEAGDRLCQRAWWGRNSFGRWHGWR